MLSDLQRFIVIYVAVDETRVLPERVAQLGFLIAGHVPVFGMKPTEIRQRFAHFRLGGCCSAAKIVSWNGD